MVGRNTFSSSQITMRPSKTGGKIPSGRPELSSSILLSDTGLRFHDGSTLRSNLVVLDSNHVRSA